uniref:Uncharacterized protein n=1 Tax=Cannabis sativa TaxID=3483 RepID=A0A803Q1U7_CANSA
MHARSFHGPSCHVLHHDPTGLGKKSGHYPTGFGYKKQYENEGKLGPKSSLDYGSLGGVAEKRRAAKD